MVSKVKMNAAILYEINEPLKIEEIEIPKLDIGQVLVKLVTSGLCHTQVDNIRGKYGKDPYLPHLLGHEGSGIVESVGPGVTKVKPGDHVILSWIKGSGCNAQPPKYKKGKQVINAGQITTFNEYTVASENRVTKMRDDMPFETASLIGCAVSTGLGAVFNESKIMPGSSVAVFGVGGIGLNILQGAALVNALKIIAVDIHDNKLDSALKFNATHIINSTKEDPVEEIMKLTGGKGVDYSFESAGQITSMEQAYQSTSNNGLVNLVGNPSYNQKISIDAIQTHYGKQLRGGHGGNVDPDKDFARYIDLYMSKKLKLDELITHRYSLDKINNAVEDLESGIVGRAIIEFDH